MYVGYGRKWNDAAEEEIRAAAHVIFIKELREGEQ